MATIECCVTSVDAASRSRLAEYGDVRGDRCLEHCETCRHGPCVVVDGDLLTGIEGIEDLEAAVAAAADGDRA
ncbi:hypothetical protein [Halomicrobium salinisoli]|uniref:hypothetical protein n=1 Tax=Halomicrobium salinisoli TaxID=2878391 RepID=UPI001CF06A0E|nr:hypothetical protein [Halomicrobium salinisoli]